MNELLPCPHCGGDAIRLKSYVNKRRNHVGCTRCDIWTEFMLDDKDIAVWNRRVETVSTEQKGSAS